VAIKKATRTVRRRKDSRSIVAALIIGGCFLSAAFLLRPAGQLVNASQVTEERVVVGQFDAIEIEVPAAPVPAGMRLRDARLRSMRFPAHQVPEGALRTIGAYRDAVALAPLPANLPIFKENLSLTAGVSNPMTQRIPDGMRAITVRVDATSAVEGWAGTGAVVDVLLITKERASVVAEQVKILSAERSLDPVTGLEAPNVPSTVTLLVTQEQALAVNSAAQNGKLSFALRSNNDEANWGKTDFLAEQLKGNTGKAAPSKIAGFVQIGSEKDAEKFALVEGSWIPADSAPQGFTGARGAALR
jgi:pilus assembly protein CpaB